MAPIDECRVDQWLWAVRLFPTRSAATAACRAGHVRVNGTAAKAAHVVRVGDRVAVRGDGRVRDVEVVRTITKRVGAPVAAECLVDHSPPPPPRDPMVGVRDRGAGRPTKRERRVTDRLRGRPGR